MGHSKLQDLIDPASLTYHLENMPLGVLVFDAHMMITYCSPHGASLLGWPAAELVQKPLNLFQLVAEEDVPHVAAVIAEISSGKITYKELVSRNLTQDGGSIYCQWYNSALVGNDGRVVSIVSVFHEVNDQMKKEQALRKDRDQLSLAFNGAIDPMWLIRKEGPNQFYFETINEAFSSVTGWTYEQVAGQPIEKIMPAASHELVRGKYNEALASRQIIDYVEEAQHPSGIKYGEIRVIPIVEKEAEPVRILGIAHDITEKTYLQKRLDAERENKNRQITLAAIRGQESERAKVSRELHDNVNQVLTTVKLYLELCLDQKIDMPAFLTKCISLVNNTIHEIRQLSKQLSAPALGNMNFKETLNDLVETVTASTPLDIEMDLGLPCPEMEYELHLTLYRIAQEQVTNIIKYANATMVVIVLRQEDDQLLFSITDNGVGFDMGVKRKGIGITNMKSRVEILNGHFEMMSTPGQGTALEVAIPVIIEDNTCYAAANIANSVLQ